MRKKALNKFLILVYHDLDSQSEPSEKTKKGDLLYVIDENTFGRQMEYLWENRFPVVTLNDLITKTWDDSVPIIITFDDGHITNHTKALPTLKKFGFKSYFFITTGWINQKHYMTEKEIRELHGGGMIVGSHGVTHSFLTDLPEKEIYRELQESKERLEGILGVPTKYFSPPGGRIDAKIYEMARKVGYEFVFTSEPCFNRTSNMEKALGRFAITKRTSFDHFIGMVEGNYYGEFFQKIVLKVGKKVLGNKRYEIIRELFLRSAFD